jgi:hypothetical protein
VNGSVGAGAPTRLQRRVVVGTLGLLLLTGLVGVEAWPLSKWRLFSEPRRADLGGFVLQAGDADGTRERVSLSQLPLGYRFAGRALDDLEAQPTARGDELCRALLDAVRTERPGTTQLDVLRVRRRLLGDGRRGSEEVAADVLLTCGAGAGP